MAKGRGTADEQHNAAFMVGIILGALGGGIGTLLLTPLAGRQTREQLGERVGAFTSAARGEPVPDHLDGGTYARLGTVTRQAGGQLSTLRQRVQVAVDEARPAVAALRDRVQDQVAELRVRTGSRDDRARVGVGVGESVTFGPAGSQATTAGARPGLARVTGTGEGAQTEAGVEPTRTTTPPGGAGR